MHLYIENLLTDRWVDKAQIPVSRIGKNQRSWQNKKIKERARLKFKATQ